MHIVRRGLPFSVIKRKGTSPMLIEQSDFGITRSGGHAHLFSIQNGRGMRAVLTDYGAILVSLFVPGPDGITRDVVLGYDTLPEYEAVGQLSSSMAESMRMMADIQKIREQLPGIDCGACGAPTCRANAEDAVRTGKGFPYCPILKAKEAEE